MPKLPDISAYITALQARILGQPLEKVRLNSVFLLRTVEPPLSSAEGRVVRVIRRVGKRIAIGVDDDLPPQQQSPVDGEPWLFPPEQQQPVVGDPGLLWLVIHLMVAGRLHWLLFFGRHLNPDRGRQQAPRLLASAARRRGPALRRSRRPRDILDRPRRLPRSAYSREPHD